MNLPVRCLNTPFPVSNLNRTGFRSLGLVLAFLAVFLFAAGVSAQSLIYNSSGTFTVPDGVTSITVVAIGGGGGGGNGNGKEGGGGGGAYASSTLTVIPGTVYTVTVGAGGAEGVAGGASSFGILVVAAGGSSGSSDSGFPGGTVAASTGTTRFAGGAGGGTSGGTSGGGGGGGSATGSANGGNGTNGGTSEGLGGTGTGNGGNGGDDDGNPAPQNGIAPGGGGGGSSSNNTSSGSGADGRITVTWTCSGVNVSNFSTAATTPVCTGNTSTVTVTSTSLADGTYTVYYNLSGANTANGQSASMNFSGVTGTFSTIALANAGATTVTITSVGCADTETGNTAAITVAATPATPGSITGTASICPATAGLAYSISAVSGATSYTWTVPTGWSITSGQGSTAIVVTSGSVSQSGNITVTASNTCGTSAASTLAVSTVQDIGFNNDNTNDALSICVGTIGTSINGGNPSGGQTYTWQVSTTSASGPFATVSPDPGDQQDWTISSTYYNNAGTYYFRRVISGSSCNGNGDVVTLTVNVNPTATISVTENSGTANDGTVCNGTTVTLGVASANSYLWAPGGATTQTVDVTPATTTTYTVTVTNAAGCTGTDTQVITVNATPTINSISATPSSICAGASSTLAVNAANNSTQAFTSSGGAITINDNANANPFPKTISVSGLPTSGITVATVTLTTLTNDEPQDMDIYLEGPNGQSIWLTSDAGGTGTITNFTLNFQDGGTAISGSPYTNGGTYAPGNIGGGDATPPGTLITTLAGFTGDQNGTWGLYIIDDNSAGSGGSLASWSITFNVPNYTYAWTNSATTASTSVSPVTTTTYTVTVTANGCSSTASTTVTVNTPSCSITGNDPVCANSTGHVYSAPMGMSAYAWSIAGNGTIPGATNGQTVSVNAGSAGTYTVTLTVTQSGCTSSCSKTVTVNANPTASISGTLSFCAGGSTTLTASGGTSYLWDDASTNAMRTVTAAGTYTVQVTDGNGCTDTETATVTENPLPTAAITGTLSFCTGSSTTLQASGGTSYLWDDNSTSDMRMVNTAGTYTVQVTDGNGCTDSEMVTVTESTPATADAGGPYSTCGTTPVAISATANGSGTWSGGLGTFGSATSTSTTYTPAMAELGTTVILTWTTNDPDGPDACTSANDMASLTVAGQEINLKGNGVPIADGSVATSSTDYTDFGWTTVASGTITRTFAIENTGTSALTLTGGTPVTLSGPAAADFTVSMQPASPVAIGGTNLFQITFDPSAAGARNATVNIASNDCDENPYTFDIMGKGTVPQAISVFGNGNQIANRASTASVSDDTDFGSTGGMVSHTFTINNIANGSPLSLTGVPLVTIADRDASDFTVTAQPVTPIDGGSSTTFTIKFQPSAAGLRTAQVIITHNDLPENPFVFTINGTGL